MKQADILLSPGDSTQANIFYVTKSFYHIDQTVSIHRTVASRIEFAPNLEFPPCYMRLWNVRRILALSEISRDHTGTRGQNIHP